MSGELPGLVVAKLAIAEIEAEIRRGTSPAVVFSRIHARLNTLIAAEVDKSVKGTADADHRS